MIQKLGKTIIGIAYQLQAQDIYIIPEEDNYKVYMQIGSERRFIDGYDDAPMGQLISHFKYLAGMNVGEKRRCQLGSCDYHIDEEQKISLRLSTVGDYRGRESLVIRLLHYQEKELKFWFDRDKALTKEIMRRGLYLFSGPVGSGKTSLMYQLASRDVVEKQIISIEDPVEIKNHRVLQLQVNDSIGTSYDNLIKLSLRHRPDILIIGEIRDTETARAAIRASLTGCVVFSTVHAKSIRGVYERLIELGISKEELFQALQLIVYQRLIGNRGLIDYTRKDFSNYQQDKWNQDLDKLFESGYITEQEVQTEKIIN